MHEKPWNNLAEQSTANAIVIPRAALVLFPIMKAEATAIAITTPYNAISPRKGRVSIDSFAFLGLRFMTSSECGSRPKPIAGSESVSRLINSKCIAANGTGSPSSELKSTTRIAAKLPESRKSIAF